MGRPPLGKQAMTASERQTRYIARLRERAAANIGTDDIDVDAIVAWWKAADAHQRMRLLNEIGVYGKDVLAKPRAP